MNIALFGFMGTGKTTVGKLLAQKLEYSFIDVDQAIETEMKMSISQIFNEQGEIGFRELERKTVKKISDLDKYVIACGGGAVLDPLNVDSLKRNSIFILLEASIDEILQRTSRDTLRPLLMVEDPRKKAMELFESRKQVYYNIADHVVDTTSKNPKTVAMEILDSLGEVK